MKEKNKKSEYEFEEIFNENGKSLEDLLQDIFKEYCLEKLEENAQKG
ncbi:MAG: hypothetical protein Q4G05_00095 [Clostridia bacterium]|nr:hypothetical protein [Clostridia bacterium]